LPEITLHPFPWRAPVPFSHLRYPLDDADGHGGYTDMNRFDAGGIPRSRRTDPRPYDPLVVARYAMRMLAIASATGRDEPAARARRQLEPLLVSGEKTGAWGRGSSPHDMSTERPSGMVQGVVISALIRLLEGRPSNRIRRVLDRAFDRMAAPFGRGGTVAPLPEGPFLEEYPTAPASHVLNGCLYGLFGLYDLGDVLAHSRAMALARSVEDTLRRAIPRFDTRLGWSRYALDLAGEAPLASLHYHRTHILGLRLVYLRNGSVELMDQADQWERVMASRWIRPLAGLAKVTQVLARRNRAAAGDRPLPAGPAD